MSKIVISQAKLRFDVEAQETSEERKKKLSTSMRKKMDRDTTIIVHGRCRVDEHMMWEAQGLGMCKSNQVKTIMIE